MLATDRCPLRKHYISVDANHFETRGQTETHGHINKNGQNRTCGHIDTNGQNENYGHLNTTGVLKIMVTSIKQAH